MRRFEGRGCRAGGFRPGELCDRDRRRAANTGELMGNGFLFRMAGMEMLASDNLRLGASPVFTWLVSWWYFWSTTFESSAARDMAVLPK